MELPTPNASSGPTGGVGQNDDRGDASAPQDTDAFPSPRGGSAPAIPAGLHSTSLLPPKTLSSSSPEQHSHIQQNPSIAQSERRSSSPEQRHSDTRAVPAEEALKCQDQPSRTSQQAGAKMTEVKEGDKGMSYALRRRDGLCARCATMGWACDCDVLPLL